MSGTHHHDTPNFVFVFDARAQAQRAAMQAVEKFSEEMDQQGTAPPSPAGSEALRSQHAKHEQQVILLESNLPLRARVVLF